MQGRHPEPETAFNSLSFFRIHSLYKSSQVGAGTRGIKSGWRISDGITTITHPLEAKGRKKRSFKDLAVSVLLQVLIRVF